MKLANIYTKYSIVVKTNHILEISSLASMAKIMKDEFKKLQKLERKTLYYEPKFEHL